MECKPLSVAIIGGGIGGITAALSLLRAGADVHVYERFLIAIAYSRRPLQ